MNASTPANPQVRYPIAYARISEDRYGAGINVRTQLEDLRVLASRLGWPEPVEIWDNDVSAYKTSRPRPGYQELCAGIASDRWDALLIWHPDRLHRDNTELEGFISLTEGWTGVTNIRNVHGGEFDLSTPGGRRTARILGAVAQAESEEKAERLKKRAKYTLGQGKVMGGPRYFGWEADQKAVRKSEAAIVRELTDGVITGQSESALARELNERGFFPSMRLEYLKGKRDRLKRDIENERDADARDAMREVLAETEDKIKRSNSKWTAAMVHHIVSRPRNYGGQVRITRNRKGKILSREILPGVTGEWAPIVTPERWKLAMSVLDDPKRRKAGHRDVQLLTGLAYCGQCHSTVNIASSGKDATGKPYSMYGCRECHKISRNAELCDKLVLGAIEYALDNGLEIKAHEPGALAGDLMTEEASLKARRERLEESFRAGDIDREALDKGNVKIDRELADARNRTAPAKPVPTRGVTGRMFRRMPGSKQRLIIAELTEVTILPAKQGSVAFDPSKIRIVPLDDEHGTAFDAAVARIAGEVATIDRSRRSSKRAPQKRHEIQCAVCGKTVMAGNSRGRYCGPDHRREAVKLGLTVNSWARDKERTCIICGDLFMAAKQTATICQKSSCKRANHERRVASGIAVPMEKVYRRRCRICRESFQTAKPDAGLCGKPDCRKAAIRDRRREDNKVPGQPGGHRGGVRAIYPRTCGWEECGVEFMSAKREGVVYHSPNCRSKAYYRANRDDVLAKVKAKAQAATGG